MWQHPIPFWPRNVKPFYAICTNLWILGDMVKPFFERHTHGSSFETQSVSFCHFQKAHLFLQREEKKEEILNTFGLGEGRKEASSFLFFSKKKKPLEEPQRNANKQLFVCCYQKRLSVNKKWLVVSLWRGALLLLGFFWNTRFLKENTEILLRAEEPLWCSLLWRTALLWCSRSWRTALVFAEEPLWCSLLKHRRTPKEEPLCCSSSSAVSEEQFKFIF